MSFSSCPCVRDYLLKVCEHAILQTARRNFTKFTSHAQMGTKMNSVDFEVKWSKVKVTVGPNIVK